eukprot:m.37226 g.37226  ORF g.37226 m.37226 type:complete len:123 (-) comp9280_c0_seq1:128-496(-)
MDGGCMLGADGFSPQCVGPVPKPNNKYTRPDGSEAVCKGGVSTCEHPHKFLPRRPKMPPPIPPAEEDPCTYVECPAVGHILLHITFSFLINLLIAAKPVLARQWLHGWTLLGPCSESIRYGM